MGKWTAFLLSMPIREQFFRCLSSTGSQGRGVLCCLSSAHFALFSSHTAPFHSISLLCFHKWSAHFHGCTHKQRDAGSGDRQATCYDPSERWAFSLEPPFRVALDCLDCLFLWLRDHWQRPACCGFFSAACFKRADGAPGRVSYTAGPLDGSRGGSPAPASHSLAGRPWPGCTAGPDASPCTPGPAPSGLAVCCNCAAGPADRWL